MELLHQNQNQNQPDNNNNNEALDVKRFESRQPFGSYPATNIIDQDIGPNHPFSYGSNPAAMSHVRLVDETIDGNSGASQFFSGIGNSGRNLIKSEGGMVKGVPAEAQQDIIGHGEMPNNVAVFGGLYNDKVGATESVAVEVKDRGSNLLLRRPPVSVSRASSSQEELSELQSRGRDEGGRREAEVAENMTMMGGGGRFRRTSSLSDADVSETASFSDMLKSNNNNNNNVKKDTEDGAGGKGGGKKKGKKGRQIDPALLGFKVTSNRIMMGEIQRVED